MNNPFVFFAVMVLVCVFIGLVRVFRGPTRADAMLAAQLCGTGGVAFFLLLAQGLEKSFLYHVAMTMAMLAAVSAVAFVQLVCHESNVRDKTDELK